MGVAATMVVEAQFSVGVWTDITTDTNAAGGLTIRYGVPGSGPLDCVAGTGECSFELKNDRSNSAATQGYYSPLHASKRTGWTFGIPLRVRFTYGTTRTKFRGKVGAIDPDAGQYARQRVRVIGYDGMRDLAEADVRSVSIQVNQSESVLVSSVLDSLDTGAQPVARDIDTGVDSYPYAFHDVGPGEKALSLIKKVAINAFAFVAMKGDGTFILRSRSSRATGASAYSFVNTMHGLTAPSSLDQVFNVVRATIHPKTVDAAATTVIYSTTGTPPAINPGETITIWADYRDPSNTATLIGARDVVNPLVSGTDYSGNSQVDGLGSNLSASLSVTVVPFASTAKLTVTNNHASATIYLVNGSGVAFLQIRGKGIYDRGPQTFETASAATYGTRNLPIELDYLSDPTLAQSYATYVQAQYKDLSNRVGSIQFIANDSAAFMDQALDREPGDVIAVTEAVTGLTLIEAVIQSVELTVTEGPWIVCRWLLAPAAPFKSWVLGVAGRSELEQTTRLGF
jgi:hypothetical protein